MQIKVILLILIVRMQRCLSGDLTQQLMVHAIKDKNRLRTNGSISNLRHFNISSKTQQVKIGKYQFQMVNQIGNGFSSKVYRAHTLQNTEEQYAIKVIDLAKFTQTNKELLENQIQVLSSLNHPNIIKLFDVYKKDNKCYLVTEYCAYGDLLTYTLKKGRITEDEVRPIINQVFEGYKYLIKNQIIHRDLKPANILLGSSGWKIADFGFAIKFSGQYRSKTNVGTPLYMPPQSLVKNLYSTKTDIFGLGIIFYELLVSKTPWESRTEKELLKKMLNTPLQIPSHLELSYQTQELLKCLCAVDSRLRMSQEQFINLNIQSYYNCFNFHLNIKVSKKLSLGTPRQKMSSLSAKTSAESTSQINYEKQNNRIIMKQLHLCRFIFYMFKNRQFFLISVEQNNKLSVLLLRHVLKLAKQLSDDQTNNLTLSNWDLFKKSKTFATTQFTLKQYINRYEKEYSNFIKNINPQEMKKIDMYFSYLQSPISSTESIQQPLLHIKSFLTRIIRYYLIRLSELVAKHQWDKQSDSKINGKIEGLNSLYKYYSIITMSMTENYLQKFDKHCDVKVYVDYDKVEGITYDYYLHLSNQLSNI